MIDLPAWGYPGSAKVPIPVVVFSFSRALCYIFSGVLSSLFSTFLHLALRQKSLTSVDNINQALMASGFCWIQPMEGPGRDWKLWWERGQGVYPQFLPWRLWLGNDCILLPKPAVTIAGSAVMEFLQENEIHQENVWIPVRSISPHPPFRLFTIASVLYTLEYK